VRSVLSRERMIEIQRRLILSETAFIVCACIVRIWYFRPNSVLLSPPTIPLSLQSYYATDVENSCIPTSGSLFYCVSSGAREDTVTLSLDAITMEQPLEVSAEGGDSGLDYYHKAKCNYVSGLFDPEASVNCVA
jgi:hypothetical protein